MLALGIEAAGAPPPPDTLFETMFAAMLTHYGAHIASTAMPFPGAVAAIDSA